MYKVLPLLLFTIIVFLRPAIADESPAARAVASFHEREQQLRADQGTPSTLSIHVGLLDQDERLKPHFSPEKIAGWTHDLKPFQRDQAYAIALVKGDDGADTFLAGGFTEMGIVYAVSELEIRLRLRENGEVYLDFPEWTAETERRELFDYPAIEERGEYLNVGYEFPPITPHEWDATRWQAYIDKLVLAKLNRFYFYIWINAYSMNPDSGLSAKPLNRKIHENLRTAISYAQSRGLEVVYMFCPTFFPKDLWDASPEIHAEIAYVEHGFPAVCPNAPGAWDRMLANARAEMAWFGGADAIQIWFYDPGGCWCEKYGCKANQPETLARLVSEFGALFRTFNPNAKIEFNLWPIWVWEDIQKFQYRQETAARIRDRFPEAYTTLTAAGGDNYVVSFPKLEKEMGFRSSAFLFGTNPESAYNFLIPNLRWMPELIKEAHRQGLDGAFGHRLEAWTRYPGTYFMGELLWDPELPPRDAVRRWADWQTTRPATGERLVDVIMLLHQFTDEGASAEKGRQMAAGLHSLWSELPPAAKDDLEYFPAMFDALRVIGESIETEDEARLAEYTAAFTRALGQSPTFAAVAAQGPRFFQSYRKLLKDGWYKSPF